MIEYSILNLFHYYELYGSSLSLFLFLQKGQMGSKMNTSLNILLKTKG